MSRRALLSACALVGAGTALAAVALGQGETGPAPIPHEDLTPPADEAARTARRARERQPILGPEPGEFQNPSAIASGPKLLPAPDQTSPAADGEPVFGAGGFAADRQTQTRPDYATGADGTLHYVEVFNPSVVPFKRMTAFDQVRADYTLVTDSSVRTEVAVGGESGPGREKFWGSLMVHLETGRDVAIPSVSPDMRVLSYEIEPRVTLAFSKDRADNYYVRTEEPGIRGNYRLVFLVDAGSTHFAPGRPPNIRVSELPKSLVQPLPPKVALTARRVLHDRGLRPSTLLPVALDNLVRYFRNFEAKEPPPSSGDIYWDLYINQAGVCRHRSFAFMITANALGIPARYVSNEAHAWVEVFVPRQGWIRIDLGGAALRLDVDGAKDKAMHRPESDDPFPQPPAYQNNYTQLTGDIEGLSPEQIAERQTPAGDGGGSDGGGSSGGSGGNGDGPGDGGDIFARSAEAAGPGGGRDSKGRLIGPGRNLPTIPEEELVGKTRTSLAVSYASPSGYRGESIAVRGRLTAEGEGVGGQRINIFMGPWDSPDDESVMVGYTTTRADGSFETTVEIPPDFDLGSYKVAAASLGDDKFTPAVSE